MDVEGRRGEEGRLKQSELEPPRGCKRIKRSELQPSQKDAREFKQFAFKLSQGTQESKQKICPCMLFLTGLAPKIHTSELFQEPHRKTQLMP